MIRRLFLVIGLALVAAVVPAAAAQAAPDRDKVEIFLIVYDPKGGDHDLRKEVIILKNTSRHAISLRGWTVTDNDRNHYTFKWVWLKKGDFVTLHTGKGRDTNRHVYWDKRRDVWDDHRDTAFLFDKRYRLEDKCQYHGNWSGVKFCK
ncbi:lamin tail domain-containing protein [Actinomycetes bacterium KLBMP 9797]